MINVTCKVMLPTLYYFQNDTYHINVVDLHCHDKMTEKFDQYSARLLTDYSKIRVTHYCAEGKFINTKLVRFIDYTVCLLRRFNADKN